MTIFLAFAEGSIQLVPDGTILLHILFVLIMVAVLNRVLFQPIAQVIAERESRTRGNLKQAAEMQQAIEEGNKRYRDALREARTSGYKLMEELRSEGLRERAAKIQSLKDDIEGRVSKEAAIIQHQAEETRGHLDTATLAVEIRDKVLNSPSTTGR